jgi:hypothetical protein
MGAQNQFFGQNAANAQMANQMGQFNAANAMQAQGMNLQDRNSLLGLGLQAQGMGMQDRQFGANLGLNFAQLGQQAQAQNASNALQAAGLGQSDRQFGANLGLQYGQMGQQAQMQNAANWINQNQFGRNLGFQYAGLGENARQFNQNLGFQGQRADMADLMSLLGYGQQTTAFNNAQLAQDQQRAMALFGLIPGLGPTQLDVMGPANQFMQMQQANIAGANSRQNGMFGALGQLGGSLIGGAAQTGGWGFLSDIRAKTDIQRVGVLDNGIPVYLYRYKFGGPFHIGVMAQEVEQAKPEAVFESEGIKFVNYAEAVK